MYMKLPIREPLQEISYAYTTLLLSLCEVCAMLFRLL